MPAALGYGYTLSGMSLVYRSGSGTDDSFTPRPGPAPAKDDTVGPKRGLSTFDSPDKLPPGTRKHKIDLDLLTPPLGARPTPDGHVSIVPLTPAGEVDDVALKNWARARKSGQQHPFTKIVLDARIVDDDME